MKKTILILLLIFSILQSNAQYYYHEQFFDENFPANLTQEHIAGNLDFYVRSGLAQPRFGHSRPYRLSFLGNRANIGSSTRVILPSVDISSASHPQLVFWHAQTRRIYNNDTLNDQLKVYYRSSPGSDWKLLREWLKPINSWRQEIINLPEQSNSYEISFVAKCNYGFGLIIDDIAIQDGPVCPPPSDLTATNIIGTQAELSWFSYDDLSDWEIEYGPTGFTQGEGNFVTAHSNPYTLTGLTPLTTYDYYVRTNCGLTSSPSLWVGPYTFTTSCNVIDNFPYQYGFEDVTANIEGHWDDSCWYANPHDISSYYYDIYRWTVSDSNTPTTSTGPNAAHNGTHFAYCIAGGDNEAELYSPQFDMSTLNQPELHFFYHMYGRNIKTLSVDTYDGTNWTNDIWTLSGQQQESDTDSWKQASVIIPNNTIQIRFRAKEIGGNKSNIAIDDISIDNSSCPVPTGLTATNMLTTEVTLNWTENGSANTWNIEYGPKGFTPGQGTIVTANTKPFTLTGLTPNTRYAYYVRSNCGSSNSNWTGPYDFRTYCSIISTFPYTYGFEDVTPNYEGNWSESCWHSNPENIQGGTGLGLPRWTVADTNTVPYYNPPETAHSGNNFAYVERHYYDDTELISPLFDLSGLNQAKLSFYYYFSFIGTQATATLTVDVYDGNTWINNFWSINEQQITNDTKYWGLAEFYIPNNTVQIRFRNNNCVFSDIAIDDITIKDSSCFTPTNLSTTDIGADNIVLDWTENGTATSWQIEYGPTGFTQGHGTTVTTNTKPYTLTGLIPNTEYQIYLKADCGSDSSFWTNPITVITNCETINSFPYTYGFEDITANTIADWTESCWKGQPHNIDPNSNDAQTVYRWNVTDSTTEPSQNDGPPAAHTGTNFSYTKNSGAEGDITELYSPIFDMSALTYPQLSFYYFMYNNHIGTLNVEIFDGTNWTNIWTIDRFQNSRTDPWLLKEIYIPNNTIQVRFRAEKGTLSFGSICLDDIRIEDISCPKPSQLTFSNPTTDSIEVDWSETGTASSWQIEYGPAGFSHGQGTTVSTSTKPYTITGLSPDNQYDFYVKAECGGGDSSDWSEPASFYTTPTNDNCANAIELNVETSYCDDNDFVTYDNYGATDSGIPVPSCSSDTQPDVWFKVTVPESRNLTIKAVHGNDSSNIGWLNLSAYNGDCNNLNEINCIAATYWSETLLMQLDHLTAGETVYLRIYNKFGHYGSFNICVSTDTCPLPENLSAVNLSTTETEISWTETGNATAWNIEYGPKGFSQGQGTSINVNSTTYTLTGLTPGDGYDFYVQPDCTSNDWEGPYTFYAGCTTINSFPYEYGFEDSTPSYSNPTISWGGTCWFEESDSNYFHWLAGLDNVTPSNSYNSAHSGTKFAYTNKRSDGYPGIVAKLISPVFDMSALTNPELSFYYHMFGIDVGSLSVDIFDGTQWINDIWTVSGSQLTRDTDPYKLIHLPIPNNTTKIRFRAERGKLFNSSGPICIDDVKIEDVTCKVPTGLSVSNITTNSADLNWTENGTATAWDIEYGSEGFTQGQGTLINANNTAYNFTNLTPNTFYDVYVRANCGNGDTSHWIGPYTFHTLCNIVNTFPYQYGFEDVTPNTDDSWRESCWSAYPDYTLGFKFNMIVWKVKDEINQYITDIAYEGSNFATLDKGTQTAGYYGNLYSPIFDMSNISNPMLSFYYYMFNNAGTLYVDAFDGTSWTYNIWSRSGGQQDGFFDSWKYARIQIPNNTTQIRFRNESDNFNSTYNFLAIDNIIIEETPNCLFPTDLFASQIADTHVKLNWTENGSSNNWNIEYGPTGFTQGQGTIINVNSNHYTLTGLSPSTEYDVYVQSNCGNSSSSTWSDPISFTTTPSNNFCSGAIPLTINSTCIYDFYTIFGATDSGVPSTSCQYSDNLKDVWFSVTVPNTGNLFIDAGKDEITSGYLAAYSGTCNNLTEIDCNHAYYDDPTSIAKLDLQNLTPGETLYIRFESTSQSSDHIFKMCVTSSCSQPSNLSVNNITTTSAEISWTDSSNPVSWNIEYGPTGFTQGQGTTISVNSNPYILTGLNPAFTYDVYVQSVCDNNSDWIGPYTFTTEVNNDDCSHAIELPVTITCNFETYSNTGATDSGVPSPSCVNSTGYNGGDVWFKVTVPATSQSINIETAAGDIADGVLVAYSGDCNNLTEIDCNDDSNVGYMPILSLSNLTAGEDIYIRFFEYGGNTFGTFDICVTSDICLEPSNLSANVMRTSAELSWNENGGATSWNIEYGPSGFTQGQGTTISVNSNPYTLTGLTVNTSYDYYVQSDCGGGNFTSWVGPYTFTTGYNITPTSPYNYSFENLTPNTNGDWTGSDWTSIPANSGPRFTSQYSWTPNSGSTPTSNTGPSSAHTGSIYAYAEASNFNPNDIAQLISPIFDLTNLTQPELIFYYHMYGADMGKLYVDTSDGATWTNDVWSIQGQQQNSETDLWLPATVTISNTVKQIRFRAERGPGIHGDIAIDDVTIQEESSSINQYSNIFSIYPNPTMGDFTIVSEKNLNAKIYIYSISGKEIYQSYIRNKITKISLKGMERGVYTIKILSDDKQFISKLILK